MFNESNSQVRNSRIMIVDDHQDTVSLMTSILGGSGFTSVESTSDPRRAMGAFREFMPDLVFVESNLSTTDGFKVLSEIRSIREADYIPVVVVTSDVTPQARQRALSLGATGFLTKPIEVNDMMNRVQTLLRMRHCHVRLFRPASALSLCEPRYHPSQTVVVAEHCPVALY